MKRMKYRASKVAFLGLLFALSVVLSLVESSLAPMVPVPGIKLGLSNIVTMYCLFCLGWREAYSLAALKSLFVLLTRGPVGAAMSFAGGLVSVTAMLLLRALPKKPSELFTSICGGLMHNAGQLVMAVLLLLSGARAGGRRDGRAHGAAPAAAQAAFQPNLLLTPRPEAGRRMMILQLPP